MIDLICREIRAVIFECADQETLGWRRIHLMEPMSSDELHEHQSPDFSVPGTIKSPVASSHLGNHS
jgi:hypothetical protein